MLGEGTDAPTFELPGVVDGAPRDVDLEDYLGNGILVLAFYPADFSPACDEDSCDLTELDLFTMQQDVDVFAVSTDSVFSHRRFAEEYSLSMPLLSDTHGEVTEAYDVRLESDQLLAQRAVFVIDQEGVVQYAWSTDDMRQRPNVDKVREAISAIGGDSTALGRYRVGHAHYIEGRRAFTSAMNSYEERDWLIAQGDFERAMEEFQEAADQFQSAVRFAESEELEFGFTRANEKATALWQAAEWLADSANEFSSGNGEEGDELRKDAESPLKTARDIGEPPPPEDIQLAESDDEDAGSADVGGEDEAEPEDEVADDTIEAPTDPADDEDTATPGGSPDDAGEDEDIDAAVQEVEAELRDGESGGDGDADESEDSTADATTDTSDDTTPDAESDLADGDATRGGADLDVEQVQAELEGSEGDGGDDAATTGPTGNRTNGHPTTDAGGGTGVTIPDAPPGETAGEDSLSAVVVGGDVTVRAEGGDDEADDTAGGVDLDLEDPSE